MKSPIRCRWDAVPGAERYQAQLWSKRNTARDFDVQLTVPEWELDVPAGTWILQVEAVGDNRSLATIQGEPEFVVAE